MSFFGRKREEHRFAHVSKRGRAAYLILCFEECLLFYGETAADWNWVLEELWEITSTRDIDRWVSRVCDLNPESVLPYDSYSSLIEQLKKVKEIVRWYEFSEEEFIYLQNLYRKERAGFQVMCDLLNRICDVIVDDWGEAEEPFTPSCLHNIDEAEEILKSHEIPFPSNPSALQFITKHRDKHYGKPFDGIQFSMLATQRES